MTLNLYDHNKNQENIKKHGISFDYIEFLDWNTAITKQDNRYDYGEKRFITYGFINDRLYNLVWTIRNKKIRPISFRKANKRETNYYDKNTRSS